MAMFQNFGTNCRRLKRLSVLFYNSPIFRPSMALFGMLLALLGCQAWLNYQNNHNARDVMNAVKSDPRTVVFGAGGTIGSYGKSGGQSRA